ncbi:MAG: beta-galactosidase, partial [Victivallales bacterium]|nr:beta-galactosidase [Victivallales bacterium]
TVAEAKAFREARKVRETHFTGDVLKRKWFTIGKQKDLPREDGAYAFVAGQMGGLGCSNLAWQADTIIAVEVDFLMEDSGGYLSLEFKSLFPDGSEHSSFKGISTLPGVRQTLMFPVGDDPAWKGTITEVRLTWHGQTARLSFASLDALPYINSLHDFRPRGRYRLSRLTGQAAAALSLLDRNGKTLQTVNLPCEKASVEFTAHEQAMEISAKCADTETRLNLTRLELVNPTRPTPYWRGEWIWSQNGFGPDAENVWLTRDFTLDQVPREASFVGVGDDLFECFINGVNIGGSHDWQKAHSIDVRKHLRKGRNTITARVYNVQAWGGFLAELYVNQGGQPIYIVTDKEWRCHVGGENMPETFERPVMVLGPPPVAPWNSRVNYAYVGPRGKIQVLQKGQDCFRAKVLRRPSVDLGRMELSLQSTDGQARRAFAAITPRTGLWQEGQEITVNLRLSPQAEPSTAFCACDSLEVADNAPLASISATPRTTAKLAQCHIEGAGTRPQIVIDGKPHAPIYYLLSGGFAVSPESKEWMFQAAARTGCNILRLGAKFEDLWRSENEFDFSSLDRKLDAIALTAPNAYLILNIQTGMPEWWCKKYPDDVTAYYGDHPRHRQKDRQALASKRYLQDADKALTAIIAHLKRSFLASRVIGLAISEGWNSEWFWSYVDDQGRSAMAGFSPSDHATFRSYLHEEYGTDAALAKAWNMPGVTMATAPMPPPERIKAGSVGLLLAPGQDMQVIDWFRFRNRSLGEAITYLCGVVKRESNNSWLAGAYYGYLVAFSNIFGRLQTVGHLDIERVARSPHVDFLTAPSYYTWRYSGEGDGIMQAAESFTAHGKLVIVEQDLRTHNETSNHEIRNGMLSTPDQSVGAIQRAVALTMTRGVGTHWLEMYENWFYEPLLQEVMGDAKRAYEELAPVQALTPIEVTILSDTQSAFYTKHNLGDGLHAASIGEMQRRFAEAAIPFRHVLLRDVLETGRIPPARFYIVNNLLTLSPEDRAALMKRFQDERATVLWLYAAGLNLPNRGPDTKLMGEFLGVTFQMDNTVRQPKLTLEADLGEATALNFNRSAPWFLPISGYQRTLGKDEQGRPALVKWTKDGVTHIFSTLMNLPPQVIRTLAMDAGVHSYSGTGDPVLVGNDVVALHAKGSHQTSI